jgi:hypothetical protein
VDEKTVAAAEAELVAAGEDALGPEDGDDDDEYETVYLDTGDDASAAGAATAAEDEEEDADDEAEDEEEEGFWASVGVDPVKIITSANTWYTLRCYLGDEPIFLGRGQSIWVFAAHRALANYIADHNEHALARISTWEDIQNAAVDGSLQIEVSPENVYVLPGIGDDLAAGPAAVDRDQLDLAVELFTDAADFTHDDAVDTALAPSTPLGWYVSWLLEPDEGRLAPSAPYGDEAAAWRALDQEFEAKLHTPR